MAKQWGIERYKDFLIAGSAIPTFATGFDWYSQGTIFRRGHVGSIVEIRRIRGVIFNSKEKPSSTALSYASLGLTNGLDQYASNAHTQTKGHL
jgi:hypothetical protein